MHLILPPPLWQFQMYSPRMDWVEKVKNKEVGMIARGSTSIKFVPKSPSSSNPRNFLTFGMASSENLNSAGDLEEEWWDWEHLDVSLNKPDIPPLSSKCWEYLDVSLNKPVISSSSRLQPLISDPAKEETFLEERTQDVLITPAETRYDNIEFSQQLFGEDIKTQTEELSYLLKVESELNVIKCAICYDVLMAKADLTKHRRLVHPIPKEEDSINDCVTENLALTPIGRVFTVYEHPVYLTASGKFKCPAPLCKKACTRGKVLRGHVRKEHGDIYFKGSDCII